ncbi:hypothetical protein V6N13_012869 [Hibiscus sabdariffa]
MYSHEKRGGRLRSKRAMERFRLALSDCDLSDLGYSSWWSTFPDFSVHHLCHGFSDHCTVLIDTAGLGNDSLQGDEASHHSNLMRLGL